jgi:hypothetical protein
MNLPRRGLFGLLGNAALTGAGAADGPARALGRLHALLVGINAYRLSPLQGCRNDAELLATALQPMAASVTLLLDPHASRAGFDRAWRDVTERCGAGDTFWFSFSGHGDRVAERGPPQEADGLDDVLLFAPFHHRDAPNEMLIDNEINSRFSQLGKRGVAVIFVADCCHAGTLTRGVHPAARWRRRTRTTAGAYPAAQLLAALAAAPPPPPAPPPAELRHVHVFAAGLETEEVPEILHRGRPHGAMSVAIASGLSGAAGANGDGVITARGLAEHALRAVRALAESRQTPEISLGPAAPAVLRGTPRKRPRFAEEGAEAPLALFVEGASAADFRPPPGAALVTAAADPELIWRPATRETISPLGDPISAGIGPELLPAAVARQLALRHVRQWVTASAMELRIELSEAPSAARRAHNALHRAGTRLQLVAEGMRHRHLAVINLTGDGTVQLLFPLENERGVAPADGARKLLDGITVEPPFGADHVVALSAARPLEAAAAALRRLHGRREPLAALTVLTEAADGGEWQAGLAGLFTGPG